jgi:predicted dinucleotide-binding enzyme
VRIGIIGAGRIGGNAARMFCRAGQEVLVSFSRDRDTLPALAAELGGLTRCTARNTTKPKHGPLSTSTGLVGIPELNHLPAPGGT